MAVKEDAASLTLSSPYTTSPTTPSSSISTMRSPALPVVIIGNKRDIQHGREVMPEEGQRLAQRLGCEFYEASAKTGYNVDQAFKTVVRGIRVAKGLTPAAGSGAGTPMSPNSGMSTPGVGSGINGSAAAGGVGAGAVGNGYAAGGKRKERRHKRCTIL
ncbi:hypothetical protein QFC22_005088 [Naganishia vaughanmartiniae]|uniref:Uncharacterized protein n=1 Tax=Naganishia vaughanmartiniae TaxID=1424756 RepID=A0ACC2WW10_9TREE|nr:hypothetical protein QFC22_005088 [Naganishia vaughanmartiniae]